MNGEINESRAQRVAALKGQVRPDQILVNEIFVSLQGESTHQGRPCVFVRTAVCHLRCSYCDTAYAFHEGRHLSIDDIVTQVSSYGVGLVELTGGEPLLQKASLKLMSRLLDLGFEVLLETSGAINISPIDRRVKVILDIKTPGSHEHKRMFWSNLEALWPGCEVKFVICDEADYHYALDVMTRYELDRKCTVLFSPEATKMNPTLLAEWVVRDRLPVRFQMQLHKILWGDRKGV